MKLMGSRFKNSANRKKYRRSHRVWESIGFICPCGAMDIRRRGYDGGAKTDLLIQFPIWRRQWHQLLMAKSIS